MLGSAPTEARIANQMPLGWKAEVAGVQILLGRVGAEQDKRLPAGAEWENRGLQQQTLGGKIAVC